MSANHQHTVTVDDHEYGGQLGTIESTNLGGHMFTAHLNVKFDGGGISAGGMVMSGKPVESGGDRVATVYGMDLIMRILHVMDIEHWEDLPGKTIVVLFDSPKGSYLGRSSVGIAHPIKDRALVFASHANHFQGADT